MMQESRPAHSLLKKLFDNSANFVTTGGSANAYTATFSPAHILASNFVGYLRIHATNTGASTLNANGTGVKNLMKIRGAHAVALAPGDLAADGIYQVIRDQTGDRYLVISRLGDGQFSTLYARKRHDMYGPALGGSADIFGYYTNDPTSLTQVDDTAGVMEMLISASGNVSTIQGAATGAGVPLNSNQRIFNARVVTGHTSLTNKRCVVGLVDNTVNAMAAGSTGKGTFFRIEAAGSAVNIFAVTKNGASPAETETDTAILDSSSYRELEIRATSSSVEFYVDQVLKAIHTTNIPTGTNLHARVTFVSSESVNKRMRCDWIEEFIPGGRPT